MADTRDPLIFFITNSIYGETNYEQTMWEGISKAANASGVRLCSVATGQIFRDAVGKIQVPFLLELAASSKADAFIINAGTIQQGLNRDEFQNSLLPFHDRPLATTANEVDGALYVGVDNFHGMKTIVTHLITQLGARRIAYISGPYTNAEATDRLRAYREALTEQKIAVDEDLIFEGTWSSPSGSNAVKKLLEKGIKFDAIAAANDLMAIDAMESLQKNGIMVPHQIPVTGFDDAEPAVFCTPKLSTVFQPIGELGGLSLQLLLSHLHGNSTKRRELAPAQMVLRASAPQTLSRENSTRKTAGARKSPPDELAQFISDIAGLAKKANSPLVSTIGGLLTSTLSGSAANFSALIEKHLRGVQRDEVDRLEAFSTAIRSLCYDSLNDLSNWQKAAAILLELNQGIHEFRLSDTFFRSKQNERLMNSLIVVNRTLNEVGSLEALEAAIARSFPSCGIQTCHVVTFIDEQGIQGKSRRVASIVDGQPQAALTTGTPFATGNILDGGLHNAKDKNWIICQLLFEEQKLGFVIFAKAETSPFVYEALSNQIAALLHSIFLIEQIEKAEAQAADRANRIIDLVRPMLATIEQSGALAREQGSTMANLAHANVETARRLGESEKHVDEMQEDLKKIISLTSTIDELSETINVIAINAAIAAARAGADGKVFGVISSEIRNLSIQTKTSTGEISNYLAILGKNSSSFIESNSQTRQVFSRLESEIQYLLTSLASIQAAMSDMNDKAQAVLSTMSAGA